MNNFITNSNTNNLKDRIIELVNSSDELKILVGFFYFSGLRELYDTLKLNNNTTIKVLVGLNIDILNNRIIEYSLDQQNASNNEITNMFLSDVRKSINTENFDTKEFYEQVKFFIELIKIDRIQIRKTLEPNHAKLYIFNLDQKQVGRRKLFITGSSNLTSAGISTQNEFNVEISDYGVDDAEEYFNNLWNNAVKITENQATKTNLIKIIEEENQTKIVTPFEAFLIVLKTYLESYEQREISKNIEKILLDNSYKPYTYQLDAVKQALAIIEKYNGVIIADVVGLGKSIIASCIAKESRKRGLIICPPGLIGDKNKQSGWLKYTEEFKLYDWEVRSSGDLENLWDYIKSSKDIDIIVVDEAHRFRNQDTQDYEYLSNICRNRQVILLTATPFNNKPSDILSLLKLFVIPKKSGITYEDDLIGKFTHFKTVFEQLAYLRKYWNSSDNKKKSKAENYYKSLFGSTKINIDEVSKRARFLSKEIKNIIEPVTIRRNRLDLISNPFYKNEISNISKIADPIEWYFELTKEQSEFYDRILQVYFANPEDGGMFKGAIYQPFSYEIDVKGEKKLNEKDNFQFQQQKNLYDFMRRLLVKRFESSFGAFYRSILNFKNIALNAQSFIIKTNKYILDRKLMDSLLQLDDLDEIEARLEQYTQELLKNNLPKNNKVYKLDSEEFKYKEKFLEDLQNDIQLFEDIKTELETLSLVDTNESLTEFSDPKLKCLIDNINIQLNIKPINNEPKRKIIIFSEYLDTVNHLEKRLGKEFKNRILTINGDFSATKVLEINKNFDASAKVQEDKYDILLATDKISEGFNLNRAGMIINYDIPWNPVRVIQRVGRINRISKKVFEELYIVNFFPTEKGATVVKSREIAQTKMFLIHNTLGEDSKIFDIDEQPTPSGLFERIQTNPENLEEESLYTKILKEYIELSEKYPDAVENINYFPKRIKVAKGSNINELFVFLKKGRMYIYKSDYAEQGKNNPSEVRFDEIIERVRCNYNEPAINLSNNFWNEYERIKNYRNISRGGAKNENSIEQKAINNLKFLILYQNEELERLKYFLKMLLEDILDYGTLADYTLRRIANLETDSKDKMKKTILEINYIIDFLGENYLDKEKAKKTLLSKEVIIAVENISNAELGL